MSQDRKSTQISCTCLPWNSLMIYETSSRSSELSSVKFKEKKDTSAHALLTISNERSYNCFSILFRHSEWCPYQFSLMDFISTHSVQNIFERFRWFLELFGRFEFYFRRCENYYFFNDSIFDVFKVQSHATRLHMCCGLFASAQLRFEYCCVRDDLW